MMLIRNLDIDPSGILLAIIKLLILCFLGYVFNVFHEAGFYKENKWLSK